MEIFEKDGSQSDMCGNGIICLIKLLKIDNGRIETQGGIIEVEQKDKVFSMIIANPKIGIKKMKGEMFNVDVGEPHIVEVVKSIDNYDLIKNGKKLQVKFPNGVNLDIIEKIDDNEYRIRTFERGVLGETKSCGTGSLSSFLVVNNISKGIITQIKIKSAGGIHNVSFDSRKGLSLKVDSQYIFIKKLIK